MRGQPKMEEVEEKGKGIHLEPKLSADNQPQAVPRKDTEQPTISSEEKDPNKMTDEELDTEIKRMEALQAKEQDTKQAEIKAESAENVLTQQLNPQPLKVDKIGRNDPCPCGAIIPNTKKPYKYKKCGLINAPYHKG